MGRASQPSTTQRVWTHQRRSHWINRHGTLSGRFDFEKMDTLFRAGGIDIVTLTMCEYQKFKLHIAHFHIVEAGMWYVKTPPLNSELSPPAEPPVSLSAAVPLSRKLEDPRIVTQLLYIVYCQDDSSAPPAPYLDSILNSHPSHILFSASTASDGIFLSIFE